MKRFFFVLLSLLMMCVLITACTSDGTPAGEVDTPPEEVDDEGPSILRVGGVNGPDCLNSYACADHWYYNYLAYEGFTGGGPECGTFPRLAETWEVSEDGLTWTLHLHEGIRFTDGTPFDANTAVEFIEWFRSTSLLEWFYESLFMTEIKAVDDYTVEFTTEVPIITFPGYNSVWWWVMPPHEWGEFTDDDLFAYNELPNGTGPYDIVEWVPGEYLVYDAKPDYYLGKPPVDRIVYQQYSNWDAVISALIAGEIDLTESFIPPQYLTTLQAEPDVVVEARPPGPIHALTFNMSAGGNKHPAIEDQKVREAIDYAIDKQSILDVVLEGIGYLCPTNWACGPNYEGELNPDLVVTPYDLDMANQILDDAGYLDTDGDGVRETADGQALDLRLYIPVESPVDLAIADFVKTTLAQAGINATVEGVEDGTLWSLVLGERDFDMVIRNYNTDLDPAYFDYVFSCWSSEFGESALNESGYCNPTVDDLTFEYMTQPNMELAMPIIFEAQAILNEERPLIFLAADPMIEAYRTDNFEFPAPGNSCDMNPGYWNWPLVLEIEPK